MKIGIDGRSLIGFISNSKAGVGRYTTEICKRLDYLLPDAVFYIYSPVEVELPVISSRWILRKCPNRISRNLKPVLWTKLFCGAMCDDDYIDVFWASASFLPIFKTNIKTVLTVYDLNYLVVPKTMSFFHLLAYKLFFKKDIQKANRITAISKGTSIKISNIFNVKVDGVAYPSVDKSFTKYDDIDPTSNETLKKFNINRPYLLSVCTFEPRKNIVLLIESFNELYYEEKINDTDLVLVGGSGWKVKNIEKKFANLNHIIRTGYVEDHELIDIYKNARLFVFPSIYEGFGMPVLEARSLGVPTLANDIHELREAGDDETIYIKMNKENLKENIQKALKINFKKNYSNKHRDWEKSAKVISSNIIESLK